MVSSLAIVIYGPGIGHGFVKTTSPGSRPIASPRLRRRRALSSFEWILPAARRRQLCRRSRDLRDRDVWLRRHQPAVADRLRRGPVLGGARRGALRDRRRHRRGHLGVQLHGIHMAVFWLSGRTELWLVLGAFLGAGAVARRRDLPGGPILAGIAALRPCSPRKNP